MLRQMGHGEIGRSLGAHKLFPGPVGLGRALEVGPSSLRSLNTTRFQLSPMLPLPSVIPPLASSKPAELLTEVPASHSVSPKLPSQSVGLRTWSQRPLHPPFLSRLDLGISLQPRAAEGGVAC